MKCGTKSLGTPGHTVRDMMTVWRIGDLVFVMRRNELNDHEAESIDPSDTKEPTEMTDPSDTREPTEMIEADESRGPNALSGSRSLESTKVVIFSRQD